jgi:hypothetical protein
VAMHDETNKVVYLMDNHKGKGKVTSRGLSTLRPLGSILFLPQQVPVFISRDATHLYLYLYQRRRELLLMNFANKSGIYEIH